MDFDKSIIDEFVVEAKEHMRGVEECLLQFESEPDNTDLVNKLFRAIHTVKGTAGFLGLRNLADLSHVIETALSKVRDGDICVESSLIDTLLKGVDKVSVMLDDVYQSNDMDVANELSALQGMIEPPASEAPPPEPEEPSAVRAWLENNAEFDLDASVIESLPKSSDHHYYLLKYDFSNISDDDGHTPLSLISRLSEHGDIVETKIDPLVTDLNEGLPKGPFYCEIMFASPVGPSDIHEIVDLPESHVMVIGDEYGGGGKSDEDAGNGLSNDSSVTLISEVAEESEEPTETAPVDDPETAAEPADGPANAAEEGKIATPPVDTGKGRNDRVESIRLNVDIIDRLMTQAGELVLVRNQYIRSVDKSNPTARAIAQRLDIVTSELQESIMATRMQPIGNIFNKFPRVVRELGKSLGKRIEIDIKGSEVELDKTILQALADPLTHLIRNCCDHGIETPDERTTAGKPESGRITLKAYHEGGQINIEIRDDGRGIDQDAIKRKALERGLKTESELAQMSEKDILSLIFLPGFSTAKVVSDVSGRGVGMDVVKTSIYDIGGALDIESVKGKHTTMYLRLPLTLAIIPCLIVQSGGQRYAIPQVNVEELVCLYDDEVRTKIEYTSDREIYRLRNRLLTLVRLNEALARPEPLDDKTRQSIAERYLAERERSEEGRQSRASLNFAVLKVGAQRFGLIIDHIIGTEEIVVKPMHPAVKDLGCYAGATVMGDGKVALILDVQGIARHAGIATGGNSDELEEAESAQEVKTQSALLFEVGAGEQFAIALGLLKRIERVSMEAVETVGEERYVTIDGVSTQVIHLDRLLKVSPMETGGRKEIFLLLPKHVNRPVGIMVSRLVDIDNVPIELNEESYMEDGLLGTAIVRDRMTLFIDMFRLAERSETRQMVTQKINKVIDSDKPKVLVVEDSAYFRILIRRYLRAEGYEVITADNGQQAMEKIARARFDLVISDLNMPHMDGWAMIRSLRSGDHSRDLPAIALSSMEAEDYSESALAAGFDAYQVKLDRESLLQDVAGLLNGKQAVV